MINYPYLPAGKTFEYVDMSNQYMQLAMKVVEAHKTEWGSTIGSVIVKDGQVQVVAANGNDHHLKHGCERKKMGIANGQYDLCPGCAYYDHSEPKAIRLAKEKGLDLTGADLYMWGHWWVCEPCWQEIEKAGIKKVILLENSEKWFNREHPEVKRDDFEFFYNLINAQK